MTKKKPTTKKVAPVEAEPIELEPAEELPVRQIEEVHETEPEPVAETAPKAEPEKSAEAEPQTVIEVVAETASTVEPVAKVEPPPVPPVKPKQLTLISLHNELEELRKIVDGQAILIKQLMEAPIRQRKPPTSNGKVQIKDTLTGKIYPSKNNVYQSLLKTGELDDLVKQGVFGSDPAKNSFGCYNLFRAFPDRFKEVKPSDAA
jgi:hypothetical protein